MKKKIFVLCFFFLVSCQPLQSAATAGTATPSLSILPSESATPTATTPAEIRQLLTSTQTNSPYPSDTLTATTTQSPPGYQEPTEKPRPTRRASDSACYDLSTAEIASTSMWNIFQSRGGWRIRYPLDWGPFSCRMCRDLTAPGMDVDFGPHNSYKMAEGWIQLGCFPVGEVELSESCLIKDRQADRRRYRSQYGYVSECLSIDFDSGSYGLEFLSVDRKPEQVEDLENYKIFQLMSLTYEVDPR